MTAPGPATMLEFRTRLLTLIHVRCGGKYTVLARRAGIPVSSLEHCIHDAVRLPGGDHLLRMAQALGVSLDYLVTGRE